MAHAASAPVPASYHAIVERLTEAMRVSKRDLPLARRIIDDELTVSDAPSTVIAYWNAHVTACEYPHERDTALRSLMAVIECPVEDIDTHAKAIVRASQLAFLLGAVSEMERIQVAADRFFAVHDMPTFKALTALNVGRAYMAMGRFADVIIALYEMATCDTNSDFDGYKRSACASIGICAARQGDVDEAKRWADQAEEGDDGLGYWTLFLRGMIAMLEGRSDEARAPLDKAYELATEKNDLIAAGEILLYACTAYRDLGNIDAFWWTYRLARTINGNGSPYLRDQLEAVKKGVPNIT
jgi:tetratricopeptide (TPR) repeat protein